MIGQRRGGAIGAIWVLLFLSWPVAANELGELAKTGDVEGVASLLDAGTAVDELDGGVSGLYIASERGHLELAQLLIRRGADVNLTVKLQRTPLYGAVKAGHSAVVKLLLDSGADPNKQAKLQTPLHVAAENGCLQCVVDLVASGAEVNALISNGSPPIHFAKRNGHEDIVAYLLDHGAGPPPSAPISPLLASADPAAGKQAFDRICVSCHIATANEEMSKRPNLWGIVGRPKASESDVDYSLVLKSAGGDWTFEDLNAFISHPALTLPGTTMTFAGVAEERQRADLIAYLSTLRDTPIALP
ncbi:MAG: ankyrin repeat domain-containing protein [Devosia sp.]